MKGLMETLLAYSKKLQHPPSLRHAIDLIGARGRDRTGEPQLGNIPFRSAVKSLNSPFSHKTWVRSINSVPRTYQAFRLQLSYRVVSVNSGGSRKGDEAPSSSTRQVCGVETPEWDDTSS